MDTDRPATDWQAIERWDRAYYLHNTTAAHEYAFTAVDRQEGNEIVLADGTRLLDFQSQLVSDSMGHCHPAIYGELSRAMARYGHVFFGMAHEYRARAAKLVIEDILDGGPGGSGWAGRLRLLASGTEAVENCITIARLYTGRQAILTQAHSFHGVTVGSTMLRGYRNNLSPAEAPDRIMDMPGFPVPGYYPIPAPEHESWDGNGPLPSLAATEAMIRAIGPENIAAVITEPMFGAAGLPGHRDCLPGLARLARKYGFLWIDDEVLCGFGRLGRWFGYQRYCDAEDGLHPDLMAVGKSINGSVLPAGGVVASKPIADFMEGGRWWSGSTWDGHPLICASIVGCLEEMLRMDVLSVIDARSRYLRDHLLRLQEAHPSFGRMGGSGLYFAVDLVNGDGAPIDAEDRWTGFTGDPADRPNMVIATECAKRGVFLGGFVPNTIKVAPPFTITEPEIDKAMAALDAALTAVDKRWC